MEPAVHRITILAPQPPTIWQRLETILADGGSRYQSKLFNPEFLRSKSLPVPAWLG